MHGTRSIRRLHEGRESLESSLAVAEVPKGMTEEAESEEPTEEEDYMTFVDLPANNHLHIPADGKSHHWENSCTKFASSLTMGINCAKGTTVTWDRVRESTRH